jgi:hypothetical protein
VNVRAGLIMDPAFRAQLGAAAAFTGLLCFMPLFNVPGYEFSVSMAVYVYLTGGLFILAAIRSSGGASGSQLALGASLLMLVPLAIISINSIRVVNCSWFDGLAFYLLIPCVTVLILCAYTLLAAAAGAARWAAILVWYLAGAGELFIRLRELYTQPQTSFFSHVFGFFPGPIYDEALSASWPLAAFRLSSISIAAILLGGVLLIRRRRLAGAGVVLAAVMVFCSLHAFGDGLGITHNRDLLLKMLEGRDTSRRFTTVYKRTIEIEKDVPLMAAVQEFHLSDMERILGIKYSGRITTYLFKDARDKKRLTGAGVTNISKPWLGELYVNHEQFPYPVLRHEIAHILLGELAGGSLRLPRKSWSAGPSVGIMEGAAVALEGPHTDISYHDASRILLDSGLLPDMNSVFGTTGFYKLQAQRAYTAAGSFMKWLLDTRGAPKFLAVYSAADLRAGTGEDPALLFSEWKAFLAALSIDAKARAFWASVYSRPSIFGLKCAHRAAEARQLSASDLKKGRPGAALGCYEELCAEACLDPDRKVLADLEATNGNYGGAVKKYADLLATEGLQEWLKADTLDGMSDACWLAGDIDCARDAIRRMGVIWLNSDRMRSYEIKRMALESPDSLLSGRLRGYYSARTDKVARPALLAGLGGPSGEGAVADYLIGRQLMNKGEFRAAKPHLESAGLHLELPAVKRESLKLLGASLLAGGSYSEAAAAMKKAGEGGSPTWAAHVRFLTGMISDIERAASR